MPAFAQKAYVVASDQPAFTEAAKAALQALGADAQSLRADDSAKKAIASASVVVAVGPLAERLVGGALGADARVVACLMARANALPATRTVSVPLHPAVSEVMSLIRTVLPGARKVAVFAAPGRSESDIADAARAIGLDASFPRAGEPFAAAVDRLVDAADVIFIEDASAIPTGGASLVVKEASEVRKQVIGPNRATVLSGALFAVVPDPVAHGQAAGEAAARLLKGEDVRSVPPPAGRIVLNGALARTLGVKLPQSIAKRAETVE